MDEKELNVCCDIKKAKIEMNTSIPLYFNECCPIKTLNDLNIVLENPPRWIEKIIPRNERSETVIQNVLSDCHSKLNDYTIKPRLDKKFIPKTLICHDYKGGYLEDRQLTEVNKGNLYTFYNWSQIDTFVYFSHHFITIPPLCWINTAHSNGVKILGTLITEFNDGEIICKEILKDLITMQKFVRNLTKIIEIFKLDGLLLNIENKIDNVDLLKNFISYLTESIHLINPECLIIWYDSVIIDGKLEWQNELNEKNLCFFELCDGIYLNYVWNEEKLKKTIKNAGDRKLDVYVGIDVFGRNTYGGGQFNCFKAAELIRRYGLSMAIFAPGWTHESIIETNKLSLSEHFLNKDSAFWCSLWPYLYTHPITKIFETEFFKGIDENRFNMFEQQQQLSKIIHPKYSYLIPNYTDIPTLERNCHCLRFDWLNNRSNCYINKHGLINKEEKLIIHKLFICDIKIDGNLIIYLIKKKSMGGTVDIKILINYKNDSFHILYLNGKMKNNLIKNCSLTEINPLYDESEYVLSMKEEKGVLDGSELMVYNFYVNPCNILEIGVILNGCDGVNLEGFGIKKV